MLAGDLDRAGGRPGGGVEAGVDADLAGGPGCGVVGVVIDRERVGRIVVGGPLGGVLRRRRLAGDAAQAVELIAGDEVGTATRRRDPIGREVAEVARVGRVDVADRLGGRIGCGVPGGVGEVPPRGGFGVSPCCLTGARCSCGAASVARPPRVEFEGSETVSGDRRVSLGFGEPYTDECALSVRFGFRPRSLAPSLPAPTPSPLRLRADGAVGIGRALPHLSRQVLQHLERQPLPRLAPGGLAEAVAPQH